LRIWHDAALKYQAQGMTNRDISNQIEKDFGLTGMFHAVRNYLRRQRIKSEQNPEQMTFLPEETGKEESGPHVVVQNQEPERHNGKWDGTEVIRFALMGDTQFGSKYAQITHLHNFYDLCAELGITTVYHTGDITDGLKMRPGHEYELYEISADGQREDVVKNYPKRDGITTYFITGNHDASLYKHVGYDIGAAIARDRDDMVYLGRDCAVIELTPNCDLELRHPWDGTAYSISYKPQKMINAMDSEEKPKLLAIGHYHKLEYLFYRNIHTFQTGCFQSQTPFTRGKGISVHMGG
jgi:UDP-2,3-diacylglucosamine pyrophosphatase LpxH